MRTSMKHEEQPEEIEDLEALVYRRGRPRHYHLLWDEDLRQLQPILEAVRDRRKEVIEHWYRLYVLHFGDSRALSETEFRFIFEPALLRNKEALLRRDMDAYARDVRMLGDMLAEHRVPLQEVIASLHLFEDACHRVFPENLKHEGWAYALFDRLSHIRIILLLDSYVTSQFALAGTRVQALESEAAKLPPEQRTRFHGIVGGSAVMRELYGRIELAGQTRGTMLVVGESGTGKELVARAIHECGPNPDSPFVALNCAALPRDLIESELFGYKRGAFSGANAEYLGLFRAAEGGTLFLDEITEMIPETQCKVLRAIQERRVRPVGATSEVAVDARLIASTNRDPEQAVASGQLRDDLYYRLQASVLRVAPLRERSDDIGLLAQHFIVLFNERLHRPVPVLGLEEEALEAMKHYAWPGNVRELSNAVEGAFTFSRSPMIRLADLPPSIRGCGFLPPRAGLESELHPAIDGGESRSDPGPAPAALLARYDDAERTLIERALKMATGNKARASRLLGISRKKLYARIRKYGME